MTQIAFGVGVGDRTNGTPRYVEADAVGEYAYRLVKAGQ
jgi:hypothetical protein